jgi:hypothetical protein
MPNANSFFMIFSSGLGDPAQSRPLSLPIARSIAVALPFLSHVSQSLFCFSFRLKAFAVFLDCQDVEVDGSLSHSADDCPPEIWNAFRSD